ncbi:hypothetical protein FGIG_11779 [Fasciola gigantica]|uniref:Uncharacterized protein n=1 Tax=Fasciola gigantica TaxID=46835 RepID=A0A504YPK5_FASGI|nr:hypothetical protein FGIG_11779 [Fasciola gigantica]
MAPVTKLHLTVVVSSNETQCRKQVSVPGHSRTTIWRRQKASVRAAYVTVDSLNAAYLNNWLRKSDNLEKGSPSEEENADCEGVLGAVHKPTDINAPDISASFYGYFVQITLQVRYFEMLKMMQKIYKPVTRPVKTKRIRGLHTLFTPQVT